MCQLFALVSASPISPRFSLTGFFERGGTTGDHSDGWGVALFSQGNLEVQTQVSAASHCQRARHLLTNAASASTVIAHIRKATFGGVSSKNTHPFVRSLWGKSWVFAHNGDLVDYQPELSDADFQPRGDTDSERAFCALLTSLRHTFGSAEPDSIELAYHIRLFSREVGKYGSFNFMLGNGEQLFVHCSTYLYWTRRAPPLGKVTLLDIDVKLNLSRVNSGTGSPYIIATRPLTRGEVWHPMGSGELHVYEAGERTLILPADPALPSLQSKTGLTGFSYC